VLRGRTFEKGEEMKLFQILRLLVRVTVTGLLLLFIVYPMNLVASLIDRLCVTTIGEVLWNAKCKSIAISKRIRGLAASVLPAMRRWGKWPFAVVVATIVWSLDRYRRWRGGNRAYAKSYALIEYVDESVNRPTVNTAEREEEKPYEELGIQPS
jgi:hypothetical protein